MTLPRKYQISYEDTTVYHCYTRMVRGAFLMGKHHLTGKDYNHRRGWVEELILSLPAVFAIDVAAYAVMSNHLHVVLSVDVDKANAWSDLEVVEHWHQLFKGTEITQRFAKGEVLSGGEAFVLIKQVREYRSRLMDISWFMRCLNEPIARQANAEDKCTGRFWEGRFKCQALLDEAAVLACMAYVDLNPVRAKMANTPEESKHTSIQLRIKAALNGEQPQELLPFIGNERANQPKGLAVSVKDYFQLVDETGRVIRHDKRGSISESSLAIFERLNVPAENWLKIVNDFGKLFHGPVGHLQQHDKFCEHTNRVRRHFKQSCMLIDKS
ncbi:transposase [Paraferrimonas sp. SM1919]|uniref:transposase n=1 Tax=Paraferrimonas sp. SM1919 TaxID=2662263 RepID=UPI0013D8A3A1|nr:transposase [Paraferrimonas sp. SM1919]